MKITIQELVSHYQGYEREYRDIEISKDNTNDGYINIGGITVNKKELLEAIELLEKL